MINNTYAKYTYTAQKLSFEWSHLRISDFINRRKNTSALCKTTNRKYHCMVRKAYRGMVE